jgi:hypothetical protein
VTPLLLLLLLLLLLELLATWQWQRVDALAQ